MCPREASDTGALQLRSDFSFTLRLLGRHNRRTYNTACTNVSRVDCADYGAVNVSDIDSGRTKEGCLGWCLHARKSGKQLAVREEFCDVKAYRLTKALTRLAAHHLSGVYNYTVWTRLIVAATEANIL